jgi:hypothetical protein
MTTSYNSGAPVRAHTYPQHAQFGSFSPVHSYGGGANPGYTPFASNPQLASAFTGVPQQPVYNVTHVMYNMPMPQQQQLQLQPQQQQQQQHGTSSLQKYNGMFTLLGGALKLAGAVLGPTLQNDSGSGFSF